MCFIIMTTLTKLCFTVEYNYNTEKGLYDFYYTLVTLAASFNTCANREHKQYYLLGNVYNSYNNLSFL